MKATLIIRNIGKLYTGLPGQIYTDAFLAVYHDKIIALGHGAWQNYADYSLTRVIDAQGNIVIPGMITLLGNPGLNSTDNRTKAALQKEWFFSQGILTLVCDVPAFASSSLYQHTLYRTMDTKKSVYSFADPVNPTWPFMISCQAPEPFECYSLQPALLKLKQTGQFTEEQLLAAVTSNPAVFCKIPKRGILTVGYQADLLILNCSSFEKYICTFGRNLIRWMIKDGIPVWPHTIRC